MSLPHIHEGGLVKRSLILFFEIVVYFAHLLIAWCACRVIQNELDQGRHFAAILNIIRVPQVRASTLFGETAVVRTWGRIGKTGGEVTELFNTENDAVSRFLELLLQKQKRGYEPVRSCGKRPIHTFLAPVSHDTA